MSEDIATQITAAVRHRFGDDVAPAAAADGLDTVLRLVQHRSQRRYAARAVEPALVDLLCAAALSSPSKSDLQQRDIVVLEDAAQRRRVTALLPDAWIGEAPCFLVFCGNNRRQRQIHEWRGHAFANDHLDPFFNAAVDAAIALGTFIAAAEAMGLGCCPISIIRNHAAKVSEILALPDHVFPVAGMTLGWPAEP